MTSIVIRVIAVALAAALTFSKASHAGVVFTELLEEAALEFVEPEAFQDVQPEMNAVLLYERALRHRSEALEIRYAIRPLARVSIEYQDPHNAAPDPNHIFGMLFRSLVDELSIDGNAPTREFSAEQARDQFNADWAAAAVFDVVEQFSRQFRQALLIAMHKNHQADAYAIFLFNDYAQVRTTVKEHMSNLRFR